MKQVIQNIQDKLMNEVSTLKYVDQDWGQMDFYTKPPVKFPCALIDIQAAQYSNIGDFTQQGVITVVIRLFDMKLSNSSNGAPDNQKENARKIWSLIEDVNKALHGQNFLQEGYGLPIREQMRRTKRDDGCYQTELYYTIQFRDDTCAASPIPVSPVAPDIKTVSISKL
ncbi:hypothetical protein [Limibacterium fermenti]|uniref:hypothetical protein n=1 Tax=Limibacterium fermenti TaxID=3229863 RepID=UPI000E99C640|nr:hypothetical protein [Porphyromonadaceae bacterium]